MYTIHVRREHKITIFLLIISVLAIYYAVLLVLDNLSADDPMETSEPGPCNLRLRWAKPGQAVVGKDYPRLSQILKQQWSILVYAN